MSDDVLTLPKPYHDAIEHWQRHNFPDYPKLAEEWDRFFPKDEPFCLCAKIAPDISNEIEVGDRKGEPKALAPKELPEAAAQHLLAQIRAQASTEFGSIQQHQGTLARAQEPQDHAWALRVMAEELRHGYQMVHLLTSADWSPVTETAAADMVEEILSMQTGSHVLAAFNLEYDSFGDSIVFAAFIDRVGKYQLTMQKMVAKWFARGLEMFGDERGGATNVKLGLKDLTNKEAQDRYVDECEKMLDDINTRFVRARLAHLSRDDADKAYARIKAGETVEGIGRDDLLRLPDRRFFRRRGEPAFEMVGHDGERFTGVEEYIAHVLAHLPE